MRVITCDRCGKKVINNNGGRLFGTFYTEYCFDAIFDFCLHTKEDRVDLDLCGDCAKELAEWLHIYNNA